MNNNQYLSKQQVQTILENAPKGADNGKIIQGLVSKGYTLEGFNESKPAEKSLSERAVLGLGDIAQKRIGNAVNEVASIPNRISTIPSVGDVATEKLLGLNPIKSEMLRLTGQAAVAFNDITGGVIGEGLKSLNNATGKAAQTKLTELLQSPIGQEGIALAQKGMDYYNLWKQSNPESAKDLEAIVNISALAPQGKVGEFVGNVLGTGAKATAEGLTTAAKTVAEAPIISGTGEVLQAAGRTLKNIPENIATNVGEMQAKEAVIKSIPSELGQKAVRSGLDVADANTLQQAVKTPEAKNLIETIKSYAAGTRKTSPLEVIGKPIVNRLKILDNQVKEYANQLDNVAQNLKGISLDDVSKIQDSVINGLNKLQVNITKNGLDFTGSSLEGIGASGKIMDNVFNRLQQAKDAFDLHNLKKYIDANVSYGKRMEGLDANAERLLKSWRKAIDDTLDTQFTEYNKINTELSKRISPLNDLKDLLKNADGLDADLLSQKAGILARRITSAAASNPEIKQILRNLDVFTSKAGATLGSVEKLQDLYNILNKYYDIAPKTGFQNLVKEGVQSAEGMYSEIANKLKGFAGTSNAVRQKNLENYLEELLNPASPKTNTKTKKATNVQIKNDNIGTSISPTVNKSSVKRLVSEEAYNNAKKNLKNNMGRINSGIPVDQIKDLTVMAAYHVERGVIKVADLAVKLAEAGYDLSKGQVQKLLKSGTEFNKIILKGAKLPANDINELNLFKQSFDVETGKFTSPEMKKDVVNFLKSKDIDIKSTKDADIVDHIDNIVSARASLRKGLAPKTTLSKTQSLEEEAKKYPTAEEFVKAQPKLYHGTTADFKEFKPSSSGEIGKGVYFYDDAKRAANYAGNNGRIVEGYVNGKWATLEDFRRVRKELGDNSWTNSKTIDELAKRGFVGIKREDGATIDYNVFNPKDILTKEQLMALYNKIKK